MGASCVDTQGSQIGLPALHVAGDLDACPGGVGSVTVHDQANVAASGERLALLILSIHRAHEPIALYVLPVTPGGTSRSDAVAGAATIETKILRQIVARGSISTHRGNVICLDAAAPFGLQPATIRSEPMAVVSSSNRVSCVAIAGRPYLHKMYCRLEVNNNEGAMTKRLSGNGADSCVPRFLFGYAYVDRASGQRYPLGLVSEYFDGLSFDQPLRENLRNLWRLALPAELGPGVLRAAVRAQVAPLAPLLERAGRFLLRFHQELAGQAIP